MGIEAPAEVKFEIIRAAIMNNSLLNISVMCEMAGVSRSGYYRWISHEPYRAACEERDRKDFELILSAFQHRGYPPCGDHSISQDNEILALQNQNCP